MARGAGLDAARELALTSTAVWEKGLGGCPLPPATAKGAQGYTFDAANRLNQVNGVQTYRYDGQGRRVETLDADGKINQWIYSQSGQVLYTGDARRRQNLSYVYLGNTQVATRSWNWDTLASAIRYQHTDSLGSIVAETDANRVVVTRNSYEPYGGAYNGSIDGTGYTGHVMDQATGLTYMQQRYYDPQVGRFLSADPMASDMNNGWNFNRYNYAANNPYKFTDPDGRQRVDDSPERVGPRRPSMIPPPHPVPAAQMVTSARDNKAENENKVLSNVAATGALALDSGAYASGKAAANLMYPGATQANAYASEFRILGSGLKAAGATVSGIAGAMEVLDGLENENYSDVGHGSVFLATAFVLAPEVAIGVAVIDLGVQQITYTNPDGSKNEGWTALGSHIRSVGVRSDQTETSAEWFGE